MSERQELNFISDPNFSFWSPSFWSKLYSCMKSTAWATLFIFWTIKGQGQIQKGVTMWWVATFPKMIRLMLFDRRSNATLPNLFDNFNWFNKINLSSYQWRLKTCFLGQNRLYTIAQAPYCAWSQMIRPGSNFAACAYLVFHDQHHVNTIVQTPILRDH